MIFNLVFRLDVKVIYFVVILFKFWLFNKEFFINLIVFLGIIINVFVFNNIVVFVFIFLLNVGFFKMVIILLICICVCCF